MSPSCMDIQVLDARFKKYIEFLEEHEVVEDQVRRGMGELRGEGG